MLRKVFDWLVASGIIALVVCLGGGAALAQTAPEKKRPKDTRVVDEDEAGEEEGDVLEITVKVPKPEVLLFGQPPEMKYEELGFEKGFLDRLMDAAKHSPF